MKIIEISDWKTKEFDQLKYGDLFKFGGVQYMKVFWVEHERYRDRVLVVRLDTGKIESFTSGCEVYPEEGELTVRPSSP